jgi:hypothetical protein
MPNSKLEGSHKVWHHSELVITLSTVYGFVVYITVLYIGNQNTFLQGLSYRWIVKQIMPDGF